MTTKKSLDLNVKNSHVDLWVDLGQQVVGLQWKPAERKQHHDNYQHLYHLRNHTTQIASFIRYEMVALIRSMERAIYLSHCCSLLFYFYIPHTHAKRERKDALARYFFWGGEGLGGGGSIASLPLPTSPPISTPLVHVLHLHARLPQKDIIIYYM